MKIKQNIIVLFLVLGSILLSSKLYAWSFNPEATSLDYLIKNSNYICHININQVSTQRESLGREFDWIMSRIIPQVVKCWKGNLKSGKEFRSFGGELKGLDYSADGLFPVFQEGEELIIFLKKFPEGIFPLSHSFGKKTINKNRIKETGESLEQFINRLEGKLR